MVSPGSDVVKRPANVLASADVMGAEQFDNVFRLAKALAASGTFKDVTQAEQAFARILLGADLGLTPTQALMNIDIVEGNARVRSTMLAAWVRKSDDYDYKVVAHDDQRCVIEFSYAGEVEGTSSFSMEDAKRAHLVKDHPKSPWRAHPRNMLFARAMSNGVRWYCPDLTGGLPVYTEADSFDEVSSATEIAAGEGDGSAPGWGDVDPELVEKIEGLLARADAIDFPGLPHKGTLQMRYIGRPRVEVEELIAKAEAQVAVAEQASAAAVEQTANNGETN